MFNSEVPLRKCCDSIKYRLGDSANKIYQSDHSSNTLWNILLDKMYKWQFDKHIAGYVAREDVHIDTKREDYEK